MSDSTKLTLAIILVAAGILWPKVKDSIDLNDPKFGNSLVNVVFEKVEEPSDAMKENVAGISDLVVGESADVDRIRLAQFYAQLSNVIRNEPGMLKSTEQFRTFNSTSGQINFAGISLKGKYDGLGQAIDEAIANVIGLENVSLDVDRRDDLSKVLAAISWELWHE